MCTKGPSAWIGLAGDAYATEACRSKLSLFWLRYCHCCSSEFRLNVDFSGWGTTCLWFYDRLCVSLCISLHAAVIGMLDQDIVFRFESALWEGLHLIIYNSLVSINYVVLSNGVPALVISACVLSVKVERNVWSFLQNCPKLQNESYCNHRVSCRVQLC